MRRSLHREQWLVRWGEVRVGHRSGDDFRVLWLSCSRWGLELQGESAMLYVFLDMVSLVKSEHNININQYEL